nr:NAD(P)-binding protein [Streptomyces sp. NBC_00886]
MIGGGRSGLAAAHALRRQVLESVVLEASDRPTGSWPRPTGRPDHGRVRSADRITAASDRPTGSWPRPTGRPDHGRAAATASRSSLPPGYSALPGMPFRGDLDRCPHRDEVVAHLLRYADRLDADIRTGMRVAEVRAADSAGRVSRSPALASLTWGWSGSAACP